MSDILAEIPALTRGHAPLLNLKKQKITLSLKQQDEWDEYFNEYKNECCTFVRQIHDTDTEIDQLVYALYGLTEEEVRIIEK